jgi:type I restriction enzyme, R subunit
VVRGQDQGLTDLAKAQLKQRWGTMQKVLSSQDRLEKIVDDILLDMATRPADGRPRQRHAGGSAASTRPASSTSCSRRPSWQGQVRHRHQLQAPPADIKGEESGEGAHREAAPVRHLPQMLAAHFNEPEDQAMNKVESSRRR